MAAGCARAAPAAAQQAATPLPAAITTPTVTAPAATPAPVQLRIDTARPEVAAPALYSGNVVARDRVDVLAEVPGRVVALNVEVGDSVQAGDVLLEQDKAVLEARQAQALAALEVAAAQLDLLTEPPTASDLEAARAAVVAAEAAYQRAVDGPTEEDLRAAEAVLRQAEAAVTQAQSAYDIVAWRSDIGALPQSLQLQHATLQAEAARAQYDKLIKGATADVIAGAYAQISQARARQTALETGARDGQIRAAEAQAHQAEAALYLATLDLDKATVRAPIDGVVVTVSTEVGAQAGPGTRVFTLQSHAVNVEIAVEEARLASLQVGQPVQIRVHAYPDRIFEGAIDLIAPALDPATRTVQVTIRPTGDAADLRPGMFATVALGF